MVFYKSLRDFNRCLIVGGKSYLFGISGDCIASDCGLVSEYTDHAVPVNVVSLLNSNGRFLEIAIYENNQLKKYSTNLTVGQVIAKFQLNRNFISILNRRGEYRGINFVQTLFIYRNDFNITDYVQRLGLLL